MDNSDRAIWHENAPLLFEHLQSSGYRCPVLSTSFVPSEQNYVVVAPMTNSPAKSVYVYPVDLEPVYDDRKIKKSEGNFGYSAAHISVSYLDVGAPDIHLVRSSHIMPNSIAAGLSDGDVVVCSLTYSGEERASMRLCSHSEAVWGIAWSRFEPELVSASDDGTICLWDISQPGQYMDSESRPAYAPVRKFAYGEKQVIQAVETSTENPAIFFTGDDAANLLCWDSRVKDSSSVGFPIYLKSSLMSFNSISCNTRRPWLLATGSESPDVCLWDIRMCGLPVSRLSAHTDRVNCVQFCPHDERYLASASHDGNVMIWDLTQIGQEQSAAMREEGPSELLFTNVGHFSPVQDISWCPDKRYPYTISSVSDNGRWMTWAMDVSLTLEEDEYYDETDCDDSILERYPVE